MDRLSKPSVGQRTRWVAKKWSPAIARPQLVERKPPLFRDGEGRLIPAEDLDYEKGKITKSEVAHCEVVEDALGSAEA
jgi:hypothetical protein